MRAIKPSQRSPRKTPRKSLIAKTRPLSTTQINTNLFAKDQALFDEIATRRKCTRAELLRDIAHEWAIVKRLSEQNSDNLELAAPLKRLHQQIIATEIEPVNKTLALILSLLTAENRLALPQATTAASHDQNSPLLAVLQRLSGELQNTKEELAQLRQFSEQLIAFATAHYTLSGQSFAATWAVLDFIQRYIAEPTLNNQPNPPDDTFQAAMTQRDNARTEGLQLVYDMCLKFNYPAEYPMIVMMPEEADV